MMLADLSNSELGAWLYAAATVAQLAATVTVLITINSKQRREVSFAEEPLEKAEFEKHVQWDKEIHNQLFAKLGGTERGVKAELLARLDKYEEQSTDSRREIHQRLDELLKAVSMIQGELNAKKN
jgi:hypothetical protein